LYAHDVDHERLNQFAKEFNCKAALDLDTALADPQVNAVVICTFSPAHHEQLMKSIRAHKMIFCEKPLTLSPESTEECIREAEKNNLLIYCGFQRRNDLEFGYAKKAVETGQVGKVELLRITSRDAASHNTMGYLQNSGGYFYDSLIHDFDMACWITGEVPIEVYCVGSSFIPALKEHNDIDNVCVILRYPSGAICSIDNNRSAVYGYDQRLEVFGDRGMYQVKNRKNSSVVIGTEKGFDTDTTQPGMTRYADTYATEMHHFINVLLGKETSKVVHKDSIVNARIADAAQRSFKTGQRVQLSWK